MLTLPRSLSLTPDQFAQVCAAKLVFQLQSWARTVDGWIVGAPCVMPPGWRRLRSFPAW